MLNRSFWKDRKVLVTGHTGFKGSWLCLWLEMLGAKVTGYALAPPTQPSLFEQARIGDSTPTVLADIRDLSRLKAVIAEAQPQVILHLAAQSVVRRGYEDPVETYSSNVMGTVNVLEAVRQLGLPCALVNVTSDKCYENREWIWSYRENEPMGGRDPYSNSKGCAELVSSAYRDSYFPPKLFHEHGVAISSARAGNAIGGGDWTTDQLIPDLIRGFLKGKPCLIRNPAAIRPLAICLGTAPRLFDAGRAPLDGRGSICLRLESWPRGSRCQARVMDCGQTRRAVGRFSLLESGRQFISARSTFP